MTLFSLEVLAPSGQVEPAQVEVSGTGPVHLVFEHASLGRFETSQDDAFEAMIQLRLWLEPRGCWLLCNGARRDVYPSRMAREMGAGYRAYKMVPGKPALREDLVKIFDPAPADQVASVADQKSFFEAWMASLSKPQEVAPQEITPDLIEAAKRIPGGYVYKIDGKFGPNEVVPPEAVMGAWKVNDAGNIVGDFIPNKNFRPRQVRDLMNTVVHKPSR